MLCKNITFTFHVEKYTNEPEQKLRKLLSYKCNLRTGTSFFRMQISFGQQYLNLDSYCDPRLPWTVVHLYLRKF